MVKYLFNFNHYLYKIVFNIHNKWVNNMTTRVTFDELVQTNHDKAASEVFPVPGAYTHRDHFRFQVLIPLKSFFRLATAEEQHQKQLYDSASKVTRAAADYFSRIHEIARDTQKIQLKAAQYESLKEEKIAYWSSRTMDQLKKHSGGRIKRDPICQQSRDELLTGYKAWMTTLSQAWEFETQSLWTKSWGKATPETFTRLQIPKGKFDDPISISPELKAAFTQQSLNNLLTKFDNPKLGQWMLEQARAEYADHSVNLLKLPDFVDRLGSLVEEAARLGLGDAATIRNDLIQAAAHIHGDELRAYIGSLSTSYDYSSKTTEIQAHFNKQVDELMKNSRPITAGSLGQLQFDVKGLRVTLGQFFDEEALSQLASKIQTNRGELLTLKRNIQGKKSEILEMERPNLVLDFSNFTTLTEQSLKLLAFGTNGKNYQNQLAEFEDQLTQKIQESKEYRSELTQAITSEKLKCLTEPAMVKSLQEKAQVAADIMMAAGVQERLDLYLKLNMPDALSILLDDELEMIKGLTPSLGSRMNSEMFLAKLTQQVKEQMNSIKNCKVLDRVVDNECDSLDDTQESDSEEDSDFWND